MPISKVEKAKKVASPVLPLRKAAQSAERGEKIHLCQGLPLPAKVAKAKVANVIR